MIGDEHDAGTGLASWFTWTVGIAVQQAVAGGPAALPGRNDCPERRLDGHLRAGRVGLVPC